MDEIEEGGERREAGKGGTSIGIRTGSAKSPWGRVLSPQDKNRGNLGRQGDEEEVRNKTRTTKAKQEQHTANKEDDGAEPATAYRAGFAEKREHKDGKRDRME